MVLNNVILSIPIVCIVLVIINIFIILHGHTMKLKFRSICFLFFNVYSLQVSFISIRIHKYLTVSGIKMLLKKIGGHWFFLNVNVTCVDLVSFILIGHIHALRIRNIYCFFIAIIFTRTLRHVAFIRAIV